MTKLIALIVEDDTVFALPAWHRTIPLLERRGLLVTHVAVVPSQMDRYRGVKRALWYLNVFGLGNSLRLQLFSFLERRRRKAEPMTWEEMAHTHALVVKRFEDPYGVELQAFLRTSQCDVLHILAPVRLKGPILDIPQSGVIAHHASMLPSCRGMYPYFWARFHGERLGQTLQQVTPAEPLNGPLLAQSEAQPRVTRSMLAFQIWAAKHYPDMALDATQRLLARRSIPARAGVEASYCGLPTRLDRLEFEERGGRMSIWADLRMTLSKTTKAAILPAADDAPRAAAYQFPEVLPLRIKVGGGAGKVIPMRPSLPAHGS